MELLEAAAEGLALLYVGTVQVGAAVRAAVVGAPQEMTPEMKRRAVAKVRELVCAERPPRLAGLCCAAFFAVCFFVGVLTVLRL